jgi:hypothetical protein
MPEVRDGCKTQLEECWVSVLLEKALSSANLKAGNGEGDPLRS